MNGTDTMANARTEQGRFCIRKPVAESDTLTPVPCPFVESSLVYAAARCLSGLVSTHYFCCPLMPNT